MTAEHRDESLGWPLTPEREPPVRPTAGLPHGSRLERCVCVLSVRWPDSVRESEFTPRPVVKQRAAVQEVPADQRKDCRCGGGHADHLHRDPLGNRTEAADRHLNLGHRRRAKATSGAWPPDPDRARCLDFELLEDLRVNDREVRACVDQGTDGRRWRNNDTSSLEPRAASARTDQPRLPGRSPVRPCQSSP